MAKPNKTAKMTAAAKDGLYSKRSAVSAIFRVLFAKLLCLWKVRIGEKSK